MQSDIIQQETKYIGQTFDRQPVVWKRGQGSRLWDTEGRQYLDLFSGHAVMNLGYSHPRQLSAMQEQMQQLIHAGNLFYLEPQIKLAQLLVDNSFGDKVFFANSGAEICELAIKLARKWGQVNQRYEILTLRGSFHGRTFGALSATGQEKYHQGLAPLLPGFKHVPINDFTAMAAAITNQTCAIMVEPILGEGGIYPLDPSYLLRLKDLCQRNELLLILDEIQCGLGRTGYLHTYQYFNLEPDVMLLGKPLGGGLPLSALVTRNELASLLGRGEHGTTFGGNPVAAAGGCVLMTELLQPEFLEQVRKVGAYFQEKLIALAARYPDTITAIRGIGMMWGMEVKSNGPRIVRQALKQGLVINCTAGQVLRFLPALTISPTEVDEASQILERVFSQPLSAG